MTARTSAYPRRYSRPSLLAGSCPTRHAVGTCSRPCVRARIGLLRSQLPWVASVGRGFPPGFWGSADRSVMPAAGAVSCALLAPALQPLTLGRFDDGSSHLRWRCPERPARRDTRHEAARLRFFPRFRPLRTSRGSGGYAGTPAPGGRDLHPHGKLSYKALSFAIFPRTSVLFRSTDRTEF
jgi:hypothetical protein